jgi:hypothetical protein
MRCFCGAGWLAKGFEGAFVEVMIVNTSGSEEDRMAARYLVFDQTVNRRQGGMELRPG